MSKAYLVSSYASGPRSDQSVSPVIFSLSCGDQAKEQGDKAVNKDKGKSPVVTITGFRDLNEEFAKCINNSSNGVSAAGPSVSADGLDFTNSTNDFTAAGPLVSAAELNFTNNTNDFSAAGPSNAAMPNLEDLSHDVDDVGVEADTNNMESIISTRSMARGVRDQGGISQMFNEDFHTCMFACFLSQEEPKRIHQALKDSSWIEAMQEELLQFKMQKVWILVDLPYEKRAIVARIEAIRLVLAYASFMGFPVYQLDVKSAFLYGTIEEEVYVYQPPGFEDLEYPDKVYKVVKALYGLHQAPRAWYETLATYLLENGFQRGTIDQTLFIKKQQKDILLDSSFDLLAYSDSDYAGASLDRKSTTGGCQFLRCRLISWQCKKQTVVATSLIEAEYVAAASGCAQVL
nr:hypothetical protein [Tanacetum cinerariifolium]